MKDIFTLLEKILPLLSTLLGAYITYYVTVLSKRKEIQINSRLEARNKYWIPLCIDLENLLCKIQELTEKDGDLINFYGEDSCEKELMKLLQYLQPDKRLYFYKRTRDMLTYFNENVLLYENSLKSNISIIIREFEKLYFQMIKKSSIYQRNNCQDCGISLRKGFYDDIKQCILKNKKIDWMGNVRSIIFAREALPTYASFNAEMYSVNNDTDFYYDVWVQIHEFHQSHNTYCLSEEQKLGLEVLDYEYEHIDTEIGKCLVSKMVSVNLQDSYFNVIESLNLLHEEIRKNIDESVIL